MSGHISEHKWEDTDDEYTEWEPNDKLIQTYLPISWEVFYNELNTLVVRENVSNMSEKKIKCQPTGIKIRQLSETLNR